MADLGVVVVGAGPTGLMLACELARRGVRVRLFEKLAKPSGLSKALAVQARTLECLEGLGLAKAFVARGIALGNVKIYADGKPIIQVSFEELDTRYPFLLSISQADSERLLAERLAALGGVIERGVELVSLAQDDERVTATLRHADGRDESVTARWVVGCDGAHSTVRKQAGLEFEGEPFEEPFMLADVKIDWDAPRDQVTTFFSTAGILAAFPMPDDRWRLIVSGGADAALAVGEPAVTDFQRILDQRSGWTSRVHDPIWLTGFRISSRQVARYRARRVFVAGDAAHIHSPVGGQGMNTGLQDAHNLAWKLALVEQGVAAPELLDSYHEERHPVGANLLRTTNLTTRVATLRQPIARALRNRLASFLMSIEVFQQRMVRDTAELDLEYRKSPIVAEARSSVLVSRVGAADTAEEPTTTAWWRFGNGPSPGQRAPDCTAYRADGAAVRLAELHDHRHLLLLFDGAAATADGYVRLEAVAKAVGEAFPDQVAVHIVVPDEARASSISADRSVLVDRDGELEERYGALSECLYLVRPDLYIGFRSQPIDRSALFEHLRHLFARLVAERQ